MPQATNSKAYFALFLTSFVWGTTWIVSKLGIQGVHPLFYSGIRQTLAGICFLSFFIVTKKATMPTGKEFLYLIGMALLLFVISNAMTVWSVKYLNSGLGAILGAVFPLWVAIIEWIIGGKNRPNMLSVIGLLLGLAGVTIIFYEHLSDFYNPDFVTGVLLQLVATLAWAVGTVFMGRRTIRLDRYYSLGWQMLLAGVLLNIICVIGGFGIPLSSVPSHTWLSIGYMILFGSIITFSALLYTLQHLPSTLASVYAYINPIVAVVLGHFILKEAWSLWLLFGSLVTLLGVYLVNRGFKKYVAEMNKQDDNG